MRVYVAGPYQGGGRVNQNVRNAIEAAEALIMAGHTPYVPHLMHLWDLVSPHPPHFWLDLDKRWLMQCDALVRLPGESPGADREVLWAKNAAIPVYRLEDLCGPTTGQRTTNRPGTGTRPIDPSDG